MASSRAVDEPAEPAVGYPPAPWHMHGQLWLSLFRVRPGDHPDRAPGVYGVALVDYEEPSPLTYSELLAARRLGDAVTITDIWVDSVASLHGGRDIWAIPKDLAAFTRRTTTRGPFARTTWTVTAGDQPIVSAWFSDASRLALRTPFSGVNRQWRPPEHPRAGEQVDAPISGSAKALPCRGSWSFHPDGPLGWLHGRRSLASFRMVDFAMSVA